MEGILCKLLEEGHTVYLVQRQWSSGSIPDSLARFTTLKVINFRSRKNRFGNVGRYEKLCEYYLRSASVICKIKNLDAVFIGSSAVVWLPVYLLKRKNLPCVYNAQDLFPENAFEVGMIKRSGLYGRILNKLQGYGYKNATRIVTISEDMKNTLCNTYHVEASNIFVAYNWAHSGSKDVDTLIIEELFQDAYGRCIILYAGNIGKMQHVDLLLQALDYIDEPDKYVVYIVGNGSNSEALKQYYTDNVVSKESVVFSDMLPAELAQQLYAKADINIIPLEKGVIYSALPSKTADCLTAGKPIIFCIDSTSDFAQRAKKYGIPVVNPDNPEELAKKLMKLRTHRWEGRPQDMLDDLFQKEKSLDVYAQALDI